MMVFQDYKIEGNKITFTKEELQEARDHFCKVADKFKPRKGKDTDLFDVLRGFFNNSYNHAQPKETPQAVFPLDLFEPIKPFSHPQDGEYSVDDVISLFST